MVGNLLRGLNLGHILEQYCPCSENFPESYKNAPSNAVRNASQRHCPEDMIGCRHKRVLEKQQRSVIMQLLIKRGSTWDSDFTADAILSSSRLRAESERR